MRASAQGIDIDIESTVPEQVDALALLDPPCLRLAEVASVLGADVPEQLDGTERARSFSDVAGDRVPVPRPSKSGSTAI
jgi:hypothetical protein